MTAFVSNRMYRAVFGWTRVLAVLKVIVLGASEGQKKLKRNSYVCYGPKKHVISWFNVNEVNDDVRSV